MTVAAWNAGGPVNPVLVSDIKKTDINLAVRETAGYANEVMSKDEQQKNSLTLILGLSLAGDDARLLVFVGDNGFTRQVKVLHIKISDSRGTLRAFFCVLYGAVHSLLQKPIIMYFAGIKPIKHSEGVSPFQPVPRAAHVLYLEKLLINCMTKKI